MLKKLLKYDLKNIYKVLIIFYILTIIFAIFTRCLFNINNSTIFYIVSQICSGITISMMISTLINNLMRVWVRFTNNIYKDEGYLTNTLPVTKHEIYLSKFLTAFITTLTSIVIIAISLFIAYYSKDLVSLIKSTILPIANSYNISIIKLLLTVILLFFLEMTTLLQSGFTGLILGHKQNRNKIAYSVFFGFIVYMVIQISILLFLFIMALFNQDIMNLFITNTIENVEILKTILYSSMIIYIIYIILNYLLNINLFKKGVNLD